MTRKSSKDSLISPQKEHAGDGIMPILLRKEFVIRHLLSNLYWNFRNLIVPMEVRNGKL